MFRVVVVSTLIASTLLMGSPIEAKDSTSLPNAGKAGIYIRLSESDGQDPEKRKVILANPDVDCVLLNAYWAMLEPTQGKFDFTRLKNDIAAWSAKGKHVVVNLGLYGQATDDRLTPPWLYEKKDVRKITFAGGGIAKGARVCIPAVWDPDFTEQHVKPLIEELAKTFDGDPRVWYIHPAFGHLGNLTAQPSTGGSIAVKEAGWTPEKWKKYCLSTYDIYRKSFKKTPMLITSSPHLIHDKKNDHFQMESLQICEELAGKGAAICYLGVTPNDNTMSRLYHSAEKITPLANKGLCRLGFGDDWPLWVPESRRTKAPTIGFDDAFFQKSVNSMLNSKTGPMPTTIFFLNPPEALASSPISPANMRGKKNRECFYRPEFAAILSKARKQLLENDKKCFH